MQNDMRDRLVKKIAFKLYICNESDCADCEYRDIEYDKCKAMFLADSILADGWLRLPCKVGGTIYTISINREIEEYVVSGVCLYPNGWFVEFYYEDKPYSIHIDDVFLTKDQAEQKLKEMRVENGNL